MANIEDTIKAVEAEIVENLNKTIQEKDKEIADLKSKIKELEDTPKLNGEDAICQRCGRVAATKPIEIKDEVMRSYFRAMLGQRPFSQTFPMFDGSLNFTFTELSGDTLVKQSDILKNIEKEAEYLDLSDRSFLVCSLSKIETYDKDEDNRKVIYQQTQEELNNNINDVNKAYAALCSKLGQTQVALARKAGAVFAMLMTALINKAQDENFYEGAGLL